MQTIGKIYAKKIAEVNSDNLKDQINFSHHPDKTLRPGPAHGLTLEFAVLVETSNY